MYYSDGLLVIGLAQSLTVATCDECPAPRILFGEPRRLPSRPRSSQPNPRLNVMKPHGGLSTGRVVRQNSAQPILGQSGRAAYPAPSRESRDSAVPILVSAASACGLARGANGRHGAPSDALRMRPTFALARRFDLLLAQDHLAVIGTGSLVLPAGRLGNLQLRQEMQAVAY